MYIYSIESVMFATYEIRRLGKGLMRDNDVMFATY